MNAKKVLSDTNISYYFFVNLRGKPYICNRIINYRPKPYIRIIMKRRTKKLHYVSFIIMNESIDVNNLFLKLSFM